MVGERVCVCVYFCVRMSVKSKKYGYYVALYRAKTEQLKNQLAQELKGGKAKPELT